MEPSRHREGVLAMERQRDPKCVIAMERWPGLLTGSSGWWSLLMAPPLPHFEKNYVWLSWRLWKPSEGSPYFWAGISTLLWKRQTARMTLEVRTLDPNNSGLAWWRSDCRRWARQIVFTHDVARHIPIRSLVLTDS